MPLNGSSESRVPEYGLGRSNRNNEFRLLRYSHIFASAVRDILESKLLRETTPLPLTLSQLHLLKLMSHNGQHQIHEVADYLGVSAPAATKNVDKLERLGLIIRTPSKGDRRATLLSVSQRGRQLVQEYEELKTARLGPVLETFEPSEITEMADLLERFAISLLSQEDRPLSSCLRCDAYIECDCSLAEARGGCPYQMSHITRVK